MQTRRDLLKQAGAAAAVTAGIGGFPTILRAADPITVTYARAEGGVSSVVDEYMAAKRFDLKHGVNIKTIGSYVSIPSYYADLTAGTFDMGIGAWDTFYRMFLKGVPIRLATTVTSGALINFVTTRNGLGTIGDLKGHSMAAIGGSGSLAMFSVLLKKAAGIDVEKDVKMQNVQNPSTALTLLVAGNVDGALSWEPYITTTMVKDSTLRPIFNLGDVYGKMTGQTLPYFSCVLRTEALARNPDVGQRVAAAIGECTEDIMAHSQEAFSLAANKGGFDANALANAFRSGRLVFVGKSMATAEGRQMLATAYNTFGAASGLPAAFDEHFLIS